MISRDGGRAKGITDWSASQQFVSVKVRNFITGSSNSLLTSQDTHVFTLNYY